MEELLIRHGYKVYPPSSVNSLSSQLYQKKIVSNRGIKYFIDINKYEFESITNRIDYEITVVFYKYDGDEYCKITYFELATAINIDHLERQIDKDWEKLGRGYYERY